MAFCSVRASQAATSRCRRCFEIFVHLTEKEDEKTDFFLCDSGGKWDSIGLITSPDYDGSNSQLPGETLKM
ncbi:Uncharacterized protein HZ326_8190 [Fusarium oxysporum f. sp. albedinis]|nr:Uncharacterized protein HZ326_8190 [Fusarium oxysporum f. sp. albedinis]